MDISLIQDSFALESLPDFPEKIGNLEGRRASVLDCNFFSYSPLGKTVNIMISIAALMFMNIATIFLIVSACVGIGMRLGFI